MSPLPVDLPPLARFALTIAIAFAGGGLLAAIGAPAPWLAGAMLATAFAGLAGAPVLMLQPVRNAAFVVLGLQIGASFTLDSLASIAKWPVSLIILLLTLAGLVTAGQYVLTRGFGWDGKTAFFACKPGALTMALAMAEHYGADVARVAATQSLRLFLLVALLPMLAGQMSDGVMPATSSGPAASPAVMAGILAIGSVAGYLFHRFGAPAGFLLGAMIANAGLHLGELVTGGVPDLLVIPAFVCLGMMVGVRFKDFGLVLLRKVMTAGFASFLVSVAIAAVGALATAALTGLPLLATLLAFAPGGLEVMTILAFALGVNPAFVATHQLVRFVSLNLSMPFASRLFLIRDDR